MAYDGTCPELLADLQKVEQGWSSKPFITSRASLMRTHAESGNVERAEELALEIEELQIAQRIASGQPEPTPREGCEEWLLSHAAWAGRLISGGFRVGRSFYPVVGCTEKQAVAEVQRVTFQPFQACDIAPVFPAVRRAA